MGNLVKYLCFAFVRCVLSLHYRVEIIGADAAKGFKGGIVAGLGHTSYDDPPIVMSQLARFGIFPRPVVYSKMYDALRWIMPLIGAFRIESTSDGASDWMVYKIKRVVTAIKQCIAGGGTILIYPSGQTKSQEKESLGGKSSLFDILQDHPETSVLVVNIYGLWGSLFSRYWTRGKQVLSRQHRFALLRKYPLQFIFRRIRVRLEFKQLAPRAYTSAIELNGILADQYNAKPDPVIAGREQMHKVDDFELKHARQAVSVDEAYIDTVVYEKVVALLAKEFKLDRSKIALDRELVHDLGLDSMDTVNIPLLIEEQFGMIVDENVSLERVIDVVAAAQGLLAEVETKVHTDEAPASWKVSDKVPVFPEGVQTIVEGFIQTSEYLGWDTVAFPDSSMMHVLTRRQVWERAIMLARVIRTYPEDAVGIMLPPTPEAAITLLAAYLAGKKVVKLNWTGGPAMLEDAITLSDVGRILTAEKFLNKASVPLSETLAQKIVTLESIRAQMGVRDLIAGKILARRARGVLKYFEYQAKADDIAVILFTSGTEKKYPKGVPLTHRNVLSVLDGTMAAFPPQSRDVVLGMLPAFHSFGYSLGELLFLVVGVMMVFESDPRKSKKIVKTIARFGVTVVPGTSDLNAGIINAAKSDLSKLQTVRAFMAGGQPTPQSLIDYIINELNKEFYNGYGTTETAPVISITRNGKKPVGIGTPIKGVTVLIVDPETGEALPDGVSGRLLAAGPNVFNGYLGSEERPFVYRDGVRYYVTGDIAFRHPTGEYEITGREKDFLKSLGGEMIGLTEIRSALTSRFGVDANSEPITTVGGMDIPGERPIIALYTRDVSITKTVANQVLKEAGVHARGFITDVIVVERFELTGIGKIKMAALPPPDSVRQTVTA